MTVQLTLFDPSPTPEPVANPVQAATAKRSAVQFVTDGLTAVLPPGVPLMGTVASAKFTGKEKTVGTMTMFDGLTGRVEVSKFAPHPDAWCIAWHSTGNGACNWNGTAWERIPDPAAI